MKESHKQPETPVNPLWVRLSTLKAGDKGVIRWYDGVSSLDVRLRELGLVKGTTITVMRYAPFGDPMEIKVRGSSISLRKKDASRILVEKALMLS